MFFLFCFFSSILTLSAYRVPTQHQVPAVRDFGADSDEDVDGAAAEGKGAPSSMIVQFATMEGEIKGPQIDVPLGSTVPQMEELMNQLLENDNKVNKSKIDCQYRFSICFGFAPQPNSRVASCMRYESCMHGETLACTWSAVFISRNQEPKVLMSTNTGNTCSVHGGVVRSVSSRTIWTPASILSLSCGSHGAKKMCHQKYLV